MNGPKLDRRLSWSDVARVLGIPVQTVHTWRRRDMLPKFRDVETDETCGFGELLAIEIMRLLTNEGPVLSTAAAATVAIMCAGRFWAHKGRVPPGDVFVIEPGPNGRKGFVAAAEMAECVKEWAGRPHRSRLELIDVAQVALRLGAKLALYQDPELRKRCSEEEAMSIIAPSFRDKVSEYIEKEDAERSAVNAERMKDYA